MKVIATAIKDVVIIEPQVFGDDRGYFFGKLLPATVRPGRPARTLRARQRIQSRRGVLRGLHFKKGRSPIQTGAGRSGSGSDVAVDIRRGSPTFGKHVAVELTAENHRQPSSYRADSPTDLPY